MCGLHEIGQRKYLMFVVADDDAIHKTHGFFLDRRKHKHNQYSSTQQTFIKKPNTGRSRTKLCKRRMCV